MNNATQKITKLTPELERELPIFREDCRSKALRLQWASEEQIRSAVVSLYKGAGLDTPRVIVMDSPIGCLIARWAVNSLSGEKDQLWGQLWGQLGDQLRDQDIYQTLWFPGGSEFYWAAFYRFAEKIGVKFSLVQDEWLKCWETYSEVCGCLYPYDGWAFVSRRPTTLKFNGDKLLHSDSGPAMKFADGYGLYAWRGIRVPDDWIDHPDDVDPADILKTDDVEMRAAGAEIIGWDRMASKLDRLIVQGDPTTDTGALIELTLPGLSQAGRFLQAVCPRNGTIVEGVPRVSDIDGLPIETAIAAQAWRDGLPQNEYQHPTLRT